MTESYDYAVIGAGVSGVLAAAKIREIMPTARVVLFEKDSDVGGRAKPVAPELNQWSSGLDHIGQNLYEFLNQTLKLSPDCPDLETLAPDRQKTVASLSGSELSQIPVELFFGPKGARVIGGAAGAREWTALDEALSKAQSSEDNADSAISQIWSINRKSPTAVTVEHMAHVFGIPDLWTAGARAFVERAKYHTSKLHSGNWQTVLKHILENAGLGSGVELRLDSMVGSAKWNDDAWTLETRAGDVIAKSLVVAHSPWEAIQWLPKDYWPTQVLNLALKSKPVSVVLLSEKLVNAPETMPDVIIVPSEEVQIIIDRARNSITMQATVDYEMTMQAPECVKAVKRLKRARRKLQNVFADLKTDGEHLGLLPIGWSQSSAASDRRWFERIGKAKINAKNLYFCGDSYGSSYDGDENIVRSVVGVCEGVAEAVKA